MLAMALFGGTSEELGGIESPSKDRSELSKKALEMLSLPISLKIKESLFGVVIAGVDTLSKIWETGTLAPWFIFLLGDIGESSSQTTFSFLLPSGGYPSPLDWVLAL